MTWQLLTGDCVEVMADMAEASVDAIVTDPPYSLSFMGKAWDRNLNHAPWANAVLRVLKPGGHLLAFGGTRTYHRLTCALEDAGFEIRDCLAWLYASGFPKSLNLDRTGIGCQGHKGESTNGAAQTEHDVRPVRDTDLPQAIDAEDQRGQVLFAGVSEQGASAPSVAGRSPHVRPGESVMEGRRDAQTGEGELQGGSVRAVSDVGAADGSQGRLHHGAPASDGADVRSAPISDGSGEPHRPQPSEQRADQPGAVADEPRSQAGGVWATCSRCGKPRIPRGLGTALKPAFEPIVLARKPLAGTVAANVLEHGTGALNIDGTRIEARTIEGGTLAQNTHLRESVKRGASVFAGEDEAPMSPLGRWPANVLLDDEAAAMLDEQSGEAGQEVGYGDTGGASRFFYTPKSGRAERNRGLEHRRPEFAATMNDGVGAREHSPDEPRAYVQNVHPTVKPVALMQWLCRLITPPGGTVLDPFTGSGSTGIAALREGFSFIGIEREPDYVEIARDRIIGDAPLFNVGAEV